MPPVHLIVHSDYLCPWCYNASVRLCRLADELGDALELEWRSYLLRPQPRPRAARGDELEKFRAYTRSWLRVAAEEESGEFRVWEGDAGPPTRSVPPHLVAKAAAELGPGAFRRIHERLLRAYFWEHRDVSDAATLEALWREAGLPAAEFARSQDPALLERTLREHREAMESGVTGVPAVRLAGNPAVVVGAHPRALYRRWVDRVRAGIA